jgi:alkylglycerol monooxygenase
LEHPKTWNPIIINFHFYIVLWRHAAAAPYFWDKIRIWFMPAGWVPRGIEQKEKPSITTENQIKFRPPMFANSKIYLIVQVVLGIALMLGVISNLFGWSTSEKWIGATLLWWQIINWSGILEAKRWVWISENLRTVATTFAVIIFSEIYQPSALLFAILAVAVFSVFWTFAYFRPNSAKLATI